jgi:hypothetical protein
MSAAAHQFILATRAQRRQCTFGHSCDEGGGALERRTPATIVCQRTDMDVRPLARESAVALPRPGAGG